MRSRRVTPPAGACGTPNRPGAPRLALLAAATLAVTAVPAAAHVEVVPSDASVNEAQELAIRVPNERNVPTVRVKVTFPEGLTVYALAPGPAGWSRKVLEAADGRTRGVTWTGRLDEGEYVDFKVLATPTQAGRLALTAEQTYADGVTKPWTGPPEKPGDEEKESGPTEAGPAPAIQVSAKSTATPTPVSASSEDSNTAGVVLGAIGIGLAALTAVGLGLLWSRTPVALPADDERDDRPTGGGRR